MATVTGFLSAAFWGVLLLSVLVFVHEGGHYLAARAFGVRVTEFFLGLPCRRRLSFKSRKVGTEIGVTPILLGGYNRISGMEPAPDELLAPALALVMEHGRIEVAEVARMLSVDEERACGLLATLTDWGSIRPYYDAEKGEEPNQKTWPVAFETLARDPRGLTEYDRGHDFSLAGSTAAGEPCDMGLAPEELLAHERSHTYLGCGFAKRVAMLVAGPAVNVLLAFALVVGILMVHGVSVVVDGSTLVYHPTFVEASRAAVAYAWQVASVAVQLIMPQHTMEVLSESSSVVGIAAMASEAASSGVVDFLTIAAAISMSLGFMNLLPIPPLDGGKILIEVIQAVMRRELSLRVQNAISYVGLAFFLFVFVFVLRNDILRLI